MGVIRVIIFWIFWIYVVALFIKFVLPIIFWIYVWIYVVALFIKFVLPDAAYTSLKGAVADLPGIKGGVKALKDADETARAKAFTRSIDAMLKLNPTLGKAAVVDMLLKRFTLKPAQA
jgi:hypothetical protein